VAFTFYRPDGTLLPSCPALPDPDGTIGDCHDADITPDTIVPAWYGERLDLDHAIYICFANAANQARHRDQGEAQDQAEPRDQAEPQDPPWEPADTEIDIIAGIRRLCQEHAPT
jgi:hypothetical protein